MNQEQPPDLQPPTQEQVEQFQRTHESTPGGTAPSGATPKNGRYDVITHRIVVISLGLTVLLTGLNMTVLQALGRDTPPALVHMGATAIGALALTLGNIMRPH